MTKSTKHAEAVRNCGVGNLCVEARAVDSLTPCSHNARTHSDQQISQVADSIRTFGFTSPVLIDANGGIVAGHARVEAAKSLDLKSVPTIRLDNMTKAQIRAYMIADNKIAANAGWDQELLALELQYLSEIELDFDVTITGFETAEIDVLIDNLATDADPDSDKIPVSDPAIPAISQPGDLWHLGEHRLLCGDATEPAVFDQLMGGKKAQMVFTDPPYNVAVDGHVSRRGRAKHADFAMAAGEMSEAKFIQFLQTVLGHLAQHSVDGSLHFVFIDWRHLYELLTAGRAVYRELNNVCFWNKSNAGMGSLYRSKHDLILLFKNGSAGHINNIQLGKHGRYRSNVWDYAGLNTFGNGRLDDLAAHPTTKPVALVADAIRDCSRRGGIVLDAFVGSGTTIIAAEKTGRRAFAMELAPKYDRHGHSPFRAIFRRSRGPRRHGSQLLPI